MRDLATTYCSIYVSVIPWHLIPETFKLLLPVMKKCYISGNRERGSVSKMDPTRSALRRPDRVRAAQGLKRVEVIVPRTRSIC